MNLSIPSYVTDLMKRLEENNKECYVVGGAIRSLLLGLPVHDYDLTTDALPGEMKAIFHDYRTIETGIQHGTLTVLSDHHPVEITTYRKDGTYKDHRRPDEVHFTRTIQEDCARRDFTVNAFCWSPSTGIRDFYGGMEDLHNHVIRCIGDPYRRFEEDALRILRAIRFAAQLNFTIEPNTSRALRQKKEELTYVSMERIREEFTGFLKAPACVQLLDYYRDVFAVFLPEIMDINERSWRNTLACLSRCVDDDGLRMAVLLSNDVFTDPHRILSRMKYSNADSHRIQALIRYKDADVSDRIAVRKLLRVLPGSFEDYLHYRSALDARFPEEKVSSLWHQILAGHECFSLKQLSVNGKDLVQKGFRGKEISTELNHLLDEVIEEKLPNERQTLLEQAGRDHCQDNAVFS